LASSSWAEITRQWLLSLKLSYDPNLLGEALTRDKKEISMKKVIALVWILVGLVVAGCTMLGLSDPCTGLSCDMGNYQITFSPLSAVPGDLGSTFISFTVQNKTNVPITIIWDESAYIDASDHSMKIVPGSVRLMDHNAAQPPSVIAPGTSLSNEVIPSENISFDDSQWTFKPLSVEATDVRLKQLPCSSLPSGPRAPGWACSQAGLYLMIKVGDAKKPQKFNFFQTEEGAKKAAQDLTKKIQEQHNARIEKDKVRCAKLQASDLDSYLVDNACLSLSLEKTK
jgi:hypothetical protein